MHYSFILLMTKARLRVLSDSQLAGGSSFMLQTFKLPVLSLMPTKKVPHPSGMPLHGAAAETRKVAVNHDLYPRVGQ